jgi:ketosteroid isomerase-like protein
MSEIADPFLHALDAYRTAVRAKDVAAFLAIYDESLEVFDLWSEWSQQGLAARRKMAEEWFGSLEDEYVVVDIDEAHSTRSETVVVGRAILTYTAYSADGKALRSLDNRMTLGLKRIGESWKVFHEHTSAPVDHRTAKAILQRPTPASG